MDIRQKTIKLNQEQEKALKSFREKRNFNPQNYAKLKSKLLHKYMQSNSLDSCIVGISGGIDSAVVLGLIGLAAEYGQIREIVPVSMPNPHSHGVSNQAASVEKAELLCDELGYGLYVVDIESTTNKVNDGVKKALGAEEISSWAEGQLSPQIRTANLAHFATVLRDKGKKPVIVGTTNRDEGAYLGYVGKYSDGMVDIQLISDLHKSEVRALADFLNIPKIVRCSVPSGDMFDGAVDEEVFGATYDAVELHLNQKLDGEIGENLERLHKYNAHKYLVGSPAVHLDILESGVEGGWPVQFETAFWQKLKKQGDIIKPNFVAPVPFSNIEFEKRPKQTIVKEGNGISVVKHALSANEIKSLVEIYQNANKKDANVFGYTNSADTEEKGSKRASWYNVQAAEEIWERVRGAVDSILEANTPVTDWQEGELYRSVGVSPLFRFIGYEDGGSLVPHYDYSFSGDGYKTLFSVVIYLTDNQTGDTMFFEDFQKDSWNKNMDDWTPEMIGLAVANGSYKPAAGDILIFPHHLLHGSAIVEGEEKLIIRTDIFCEHIKHS